MPEQLSWRACATASEFEMCCSKRPHLSFLSFFSFFSFLSFLSFLPASSSSSPPCFSFLLFLPCSSSFLSFLSFFSLRSSSAPSSLPFLSFLSFLLRLSSSPSPEAPFLLVDGPGAPLESSSRRSSVRMLGMPSPKLSLMGLFFAAAPSFPNSSGSWRRIRQERGLQSCSTLPRLSQSSMRISIMQPTRFDEALPVWADTSCCSRKSFKAVYSTSPPFTRDSFSIWPFTCVTSVSDICP
mmetsp:Transcript_14201/g.32210  ORF Transcript_14201/g.32210 Transcript_14201/m.32210 type:complete len:239 (+) Transcript_14201:60-776(+)